LKVFPFIFVSMLILFPVIIIVIMVGVLFTIAMLLMRFIIEKWIAVRSSRAFDFVVLVYE
jgi:hypothetical protein